MTNTQKRKQLKRLKNGIQKTLGRDITESIRVINDHGNGPILVWEGLYDWPSTIGGGCSIMAGETGQYSKPQESAIREAVEKVQADGCHFEAINGYSIAVFD